MSIFNLVTEVVKMPSKRGKKKKRSKKNKHTPDNAGGGGFVSTVVNAFTKMMPSRSR